MSDPSPSKYTVSSYDRISLELLSMATDLVSSHVAQNTISMDDIPHHLKQMYHFLADLMGHTTISMKRQEPAVPIKKSIEKDYLICLEDGKRLKMLKRHLKTFYNMTPEDYIARWGLAKDYPMVAPSYGEQRSTLAKKIGLGRKRKLEAA